MSAVPTYLRLPVNAQALREARWSLGFSQTTLAVAAGVSLRTIVIGEAQGIASRKTLQKLAGALRLPMEALLLPEPPTAPPISPPPEFRVGALPPPQAQEAPR